MSTMVFNQKFFKKISKLNQKDIILWVSSCSLPDVNREKRAAIEYLLGTISSFKQTSKVNKEPSRRDINYLFREIFYEMSKYTDRFKEDRFLFCFTLGYLAIRGEAFPWQLAEAAIERYHEHNGWMEKNLGFNIEDAVDFTRLIINEITRRMINSIAPSFPEFKKEQYYDPNYILIPQKYCSNFWGEMITFPKKKLLQLVDQSKQNKFEGYLMRMSMDLEATEIEEPMEIGDYNPLTGRPIIKLNQEYLFPLPSMLWRSLPKTFHYDILSDNFYKGYYIDVKGKVAENRAEKCFVKLFSKNDIKKRVRYNKDKGWPDVDIIINDMDATILVECTAKWVSQQSKKGYVQSIIKDLRESIGKCQKQLYRAETAIKEGKIEVANPSRIIPIVLVDEYIPNLESILHESNFLAEHRQYMIDTYSLDIIADFTDKKEFINFVFERIEVSKQGVMFCADELDYFVFYKHRGFKDYITNFKKNKSTFFYTGHIEDLDPSYYAQKLISFVKDNQLATKLLNEKQGLLYGWS